MDLVGTGIRSQGPGAKPQREAQVHREARRAYYYPMDLEGTGTALSVSEKSESSEDPSRRTKSRYELTKYQESVGLRVYVPRNSRSVHRFIRNRRLSVGYCRLAERPMDFYHG